MRIDRKAKYAQSLVEVVLPNRGFPFCRAAFEYLRAPDVVDENVDVAVIFPNPIGERLHLRGIEMVDRYRDAAPAELSDELSRLFDRLGAAVFRSRRARRAPGTDDRRTGFAQRGRDPATRAARRARDDRDAAAQRSAIRNPGHRS